MTEDWAPKEDIGQRWDVFEKSFAQIPDLSAFLRSQRSNPSAFEGIPPVLGSTELFSTEIAYVTPAAAFVPAIGGAAATANRRNTEMLFQPREPVVGR